MDWQTLRNQFMRATGGDMPGGPLEQALIDAYAEHPTAVERAVEKITLAHAAGKVRSPWGALKSEVERAVQAANNPTHDQGSSREKAIQRAEQRIRNELLHYDRLEEVLDELFGDRGTLKDHHTPNLEQRMTDHWHELRPLGTATELEAEARGLRYQQQPKITADTKPRSLEDLKAIAARKGADTTRL